MRSKSQIASNSSYLEPISKLLGGVDRSSARSSGVAFPLARPPHRHRHDHSSVAEKRRTKSGFSFANGDCVTAAASDTAQSAGEDASQMKDRISDTASDYADSVRDFAGEAGRAVTERSARLSR